MKNKIYVSLVLLILFSCTKKEYVIKNEYQIISLIYSDVVNQIDNFKPLPPPPFISKSKYSKKQLDSINLAYIKLTDKLISANTKKDSKEFIKKIAIYPKLTLPKSLDFELDNKLYGFKNLFLKFKKIKDIKNIDISKISTKNNNSLLYFNEDLLIKDSKDFHEFDILISFSNIALNENLNKAIIICSVNMSKLSGVSTMFFLEKTKSGNWIIRFDKELSIS